MWLLRCFILIIIYYLAVVRDQTEAHPRLSLSRDCISRKTRYKSVASTSLFLRACDLNATHNAADTCLSHFITQHTYRHAAGPIIITHTHTHTDKLSYSIKKETRTVTHSHVVTYRLQQLLVFEFLRFGGHFLLL